MRSQHEQAPSVVMDPAKTAGLIAIGAIVTLVALRVFLERK